MNLTRCPTSATSLAGVTSTVVTAEASGLAAPSCIPPFGAARNESDIVSRRKASRVDRISVPRPCFYTGGTDPPVDAAVVLDSVAHMRAHWIARPRHPGLPEAELHVDHLRELHRDTRLYCGPEPRLIGSAYCFLVQTIRQSRE